MSDQVVDDLEFPCSDSNGEPQVVVMIFNSSKVRQDQEYVTSRARHMDRALCLGVHADSCSFALYKWFGFRPVIALPHCLELHPASLTGGEPRMSLGEPTGGERYGVCHVRAGGSPMRRPCAASFQMYNVIKSNCKFMISTKCQLCNCHGARSCTQT